MQKTHAVPQLAWLGFSRTCSAPLCVTLCQLAARLRYSFRSPCCSGTFSDMKRSTSTASRPNVFRSPERSSRGAEPVYSDPESPLHVLAFHSTALTTTELTSSVFIEGKESSNGADECCVIDCRRGVLSYIFERGSARGHTKCRAANDILVRANFRDRPSEGNGEIHGRLDRDHSCGCLVTDQLKLKHNVVERSHHRWLRVVVRENNKEKRAVKCE